MSIKAVLAKLADYVVTHASRHNPAQYQEYDAALKRGEISALSCGVNNGALTARVADSYRVQAMTETMKETWIRRIELYEGPTKIAWARVVTKRYLHEATDIHSTAPKWHLSTSLGMAELEAKIGQLTDS